MTKLPSWGTMPTTPAECSDPKTYALLSSGLTLGIFQLEGKGMRDLLRRLRPTKFADIAAVLALYRPGPMAAEAHLQYADRKNNNGGKWQKEWAIHADLEAPLRPVLENTYGLIVFQEQVLQALAVVCDWSYADAALLFDAMRKKKLDKMLETKPSYMADGKSNGFSEEALEALWEVLVPFSDYSFNLSHASGYGLISYWTAYLKANHPVAFFTALLSHNDDDTAALGAMIEDAGKFGVQILPPDVNESGLDFTATKKGVRVGLRAIKGLGGTAVQALLEARPFTSLQDFYDRIPQKVNSGGLQALIKAGAFDSFGSRVEHFDSYEQMLSQARYLKQSAPFGDKPLLSPKFTLPSEHTDTDQMMSWERELLGIPLTTQKLVVDLDRELLEEEWEWINGQLAHCPGPHKVTYNLRSFSFKSSTGVNPSGRLVEILRALPGVTPKLI